MRTTTRLVAGTLIFVIALPPFAAAAAEPAPPISGPPASTSHEITPRVSGGDSNPARAGMTDIIARDARRLAAAPAQGLPRPIARQSQRGKHVLVGACIGAIAGLAVGSILGYQYGRNEGAVGTGIAFFGIPGTLAGAGIGAVVGLAIP